MTLPDSISHVLGTTQINIVLVKLILIQVLSVFRLLGASIVHRHLTTRPRKLTDVVAVCSVLHPLNIWVTVLVIVLIIRLISIAGTLI